jgi:hypothetical protein
MATDLLPKQTHTDTDIQKVLETIDRDDQAYYDSKKNMRKVPIFAYDIDGNATRITHWQNRPVAPQGMTLTEAQAAGLDYYLQGRGWVRLGKKAERDFDAPPRG